MKKSYLILFFPLIISFRLSAQNDLEGTWEGKFEGDYMTSQVRWTFTGQIYQLDLENDGSVEVTGRWETEGEHLFLWDTGGPMGCPETQRGEYTYQITGDKLKLALVGDICPGRKMMGPNIEWVKKK